MGGPTPYDEVYSRFDSPLMQRVRAEAYGEDIGQHSWVTAAQLRRDIALLDLSERTRLLDVGCGPGGPLTFLVAAAGCRSVGVDSNPSAVAAGRERAERMQLGALVMFGIADAERLPFGDRSFDAVVSYDVVLHIPDRPRAFAELARVIAPGGRVLFTDAGVVTGPISSAEIAARSAMATAFFVPDGYNEPLLGDAGFRLIEREDRTEDVLEIAEGRIRARRAHRAELERAEGATGYAHQQSYLDAAVALAGRRALSRFAYVAERRL